MKQNQQNILTEEADQESTIDCELRELYHCIQHLELQVDKITDKTRSVRKICPIKGDDAKGNPVDGSPLLCTLRAMKLEILKQTERIGQLTCEIEL